MNNFNGMANTMPLNGVGVMPQRSQFSNYFNPTSVASASTNNIVWVQGIEGAKAWQLNPNSMVILLDSEVEGKMYIKVSDNIGMSSLRIFNYAEEVPSANNVTTNNNLDLSQYVTREELNKLVKEIMENERPVSTVASDSKTTAGESATTTVKPKVICSPIKQ